MKRVRKQKVDLSFGASSNDDLKWFDTKVLTTLNASDNQLEDVAEQVADFRDLEQLDLRSNWLTTLPDNLARLVCLTTLTLSSNRISGEIPLCLLAMPNLASLDLSHNSLDTLIGNEWKQALQILDFQLQSAKEEDDEDPGGFFSAFPSIKTADSPTSKASDGAPWPRLTSLNISHNKLTNAALAQAIDLLPRSLVKLNLANNRLCPALPIPFFSPLTQLADLNLSHNAFDSKQDFFNSKADKDLMPALRWLDLASCELDDLAFLEVIIGLPHSLQGLPKSMTGYQKASGTKDVLQVNVAGNYLRDELARLRKSKPAPMQPEDEEEDTSGPITPPRLSHVRVSAGSYTFPFASNIDIANKSLHLSQKGLNDRILAAAIGEDLDLNVQILNLAKTRFQLFQ